MKVFNEYQLFWGDLHNHCEVGYGKGSLQRSIEIAREELDFFAFTGHASWHDMPVLADYKQRVWEEGIKKHADHWNETRKQIESASEENLSAFLGYEWHSSEYGDYCLVFPHDQSDLFLPASLPELLDFAKEKGALAIPHHVAYKQGWRGANWSYFRSDVSPVVEVFSEHGCSLSTEESYPMLTHSNGARTTENSVYRQLNKGLRFGFIASTDDHLGHPGAYNEGRAGVWALDNASASVFDAIKNRRTFAVTGDKIVVKFSINDKPMGSEIDFCRSRKVKIFVQGQDSIREVHIIRNGDVVDRFTPRNFPPSQDGKSREYKIRVEYGWGPTGEMGINRICDWEMTFGLEKGTIRDIHGCFQSSPFDETRRDQIRQIDNNTTWIKSFTARSGRINQKPTKSFVCSFEAEPTSDVILEVKHPKRVQKKVPLQKLLLDNDVTFTGGYSSESIAIHKPVIPEEYEMEIEWEDTMPQKNGGDWYLVRVEQKNAQLAWSSPIWIG